MEKHMNFLLLKFSSFLQVFSSFETGTYFVKKKRVLLLPYHYLIINYSIFFICFINNI